VTRPHGQVDAAEVEECLGGRRLVAMLEQRGDSRQVVCERGLERVVQ